jgi:hypothetical protein
VGNRLLTAWATAQLDRHDAFALRWAETIYIPAYISLYLPRY